jgi:hypothetical protein
VEAAQFVFTFQAPPATFVKVPSALKAAGTRAENASIEAMLRVRTRRGSGLFMEE